MFVGTLVFILASVLLRVLIRKSSVIFNTGTKLNVNINVNVFICKNINLNINIGTH